MQIYSSWGAPAGVWPVRVALAQPGAFLFRIFQQYLCIWVSYVPCMCLSIQDKILSWQKRRIFPFISTPSVDLWHWEAVEVGPWPAQWLPWHNAEAEGKPTLVQSPSLYPVTFMWSWCHATLPSCLHHHLRNPADFQFLTLAGRI